MKIISYLFDGRINAKNYLIEMTAEEYLNIARHILANNEFQRKRVKSSNTVYSLLKEDFMDGCVIPAIVLGLNADVDFDNSARVSETIAENIDNLVILDGLQRTYSLIDLEREVKTDADKFKKFNASPLRIEIYLSINRIGVLYRMLTLNTGQSPMSIRQQIEMLYLDYMKKPLDGITFIREIDDDAPKKIGDYTFKSVADGFNSYIERSELPIDRGDILENIKGLEKLSSENKNENIFDEFIITYDSFVKKYDELLGDVKFTAEELEIKGEPFGKDILRIFSKSQPMTGFGAAMGRLRDISHSNNFDLAKDAIAQLKSSKDVRETTGYLLGRMERIRSNSKKIGNSQRLFFSYYFRELLNPESHAYRDLYLAAEEAYRKYETQVM